MRAVNIRAAGDRRFSAAIIWLESPRAFLCGLNECLMRHGAFTRMY